MKKQSFSSLRLGAPKSPMRKLFLPGAALCALFVQAVAMPVLAGPPRKNVDDGGARDLLLMCQGRYEDPELGLAMCTAYLKGYLDRAHYNHREGGAVEFCSETGRINPKAAAKAVTEFAFSDPNALDEPMPIFLSLALQRAYPCSEELAAKILEEENKPPPQPVPFVPKRPAGLVGASKVVTMSDQQPPPPVPIPPRAAGPVVKEGPEPPVPSAAYTGPEAGPAGGGRAIPPRALDDSIAPAAAPGTRKAAMTAGGVTRDATTEIVVRPERGKGGSATGRSVALSAGQVSVKSGAVPAAPVKSRAVGMPPSMTQPSGAAIPKINPPETMGGDTSAATDASHAKALPPNTKPYGAINSDGTPAPKRP